MAEEKLRKYLEYKYKRQRNRKCDSEKLRTKKPQFMRSNI